VIRTAVLVGFAGLAAATALFLWQGLGPVVGAFAAAGLGILWASLFHVVPMAINAAAWQVLVPKRPRRPSLADFFWAVWLREAVNGLLPVARVGGEIVTARLLVHRGLASAVAVASVVADVTVGIVTQFIMAIVGVALLALRGADASIISEIAVGLLIAVPIVAALVLVQRFGLFALFARLFRALFGGRFDKMVGGAHSLDRAVRQLYRRRAAVLACGVLQLVGWVAGAGEIWIALVYLGHPVGFDTAIIFEALIQALSSGAFIVPAALGIQEGGFLVIGSLVGVPPDIALALALARRARDIIIFAPALVVWQLTLGRRLLRV
jgi:putative membrane protein